MGSQIVRKIPKEMMVQTESNLNAQFERKNNLSFKIKLTWANNVENQTHVRQRRGKGPATAGARAGARVCMPPGELELAEGNSG